MNINELEKLLKNFYQISGMMVAIVDTNYKPILSIRHQFDNFCKAIHQYPKCMDICYESDIIYLDEVNKTGKTVIFSCPFGFFYAFVTIKNGEKIIAYISISYALDESLSSPETPLKVLKSIIPDYNEGLFKTLIKNTPRHTTEKLRAYADTLTMFSEIIEHKHLLSAIPQSISFKTKSYIDQNLNKKITLPELSKQLHCSTVTITEHFKRKYGLTVMEYVLQQRMKTAKKLLEYDVYNINDISNLCGFKDVEYFSRQFKKIYGISPSYWKKQKNTGDTH